MFQPKRQVRFVLLITAMLFGLVFFPYSARMATADTSGATVGANPSPTATPISTPIATRDPESPIVCGAGCFNPSIYSRTAAGSIWVVVNKRTPLNPIKFKPILDKSINLAVPAASAYKQLKAEVSRQRLGTLCLNSGYRSYATQSATHAYQIARGKKYGYDGETVAARPGYSEHQTGLAADVSITSLNCKITNFGSSKASKWIAENAWQFGFIVRYPQGEQSTTGYIWEPWHLRYVGPELAAQMHLTGVKVLEKFWAMPAAATYLKK